MIGRQPASRLASCAPTPTSTNMQEFEKLKSTLELAVSKKAGDGSASVAYSRSGQKYFAGSVDSDTNILNVTSEHASLCLSTLNTDYGIEKIVTLAGNGVAISPIPLKIIADYSLRTKLPVSYKLINQDQNIIFETRDVFEALNFYKPEEILLSRIQNSKFSQNYTEARVSEPLELKQFAVQGIERNFPLYDSASGYGTALTTKSGKVYFGGQYSSPDKRLGLHSEMTTMISALMAGEREIESIGIVSSKFPDSPCDMCGICRQFLAEISAKLNIDPVLYCFSRDTDEYKTYKINDYLPSVWTSKKW